MIKKLRREIARQNAIIRRDRYDRLNEYNVEAAELWELLTETVRYIAHLETHMALLKSELIAEKGEFFTNVPLSNIFSFKYVPCKS